MAPDRLERLTDLVLVLLAASRPMTLEEIGNEVPGYPVGLDARRQAFERDKRLLRSEGIPVLTQQIGGAEQYGYRIEPDALYLQDLDFTEDEQAALQLAVAAVDLGDAGGRDALLKLGTSGAAGIRPYAALRSPRWLANLFDAIRSRAEVSFSYRGIRRTVAPGGLRFRNGWWYLIGWDRDRADARRFRVDRVEDEPSLGPPGSGAVPPGFDAEEAAPDQPAPAGGEDSGDVTIVVDSTESTRVLAEVGDTAVLERREDGSIVFCLKVNHEDVLRTWILGLGHHAVVIGPDSFLRSTIAWLEGIAEAKTVGEASISAGSESPVEAKLEVSSFRDGAIVVPSAPRDTRERLRVLLAMVSWLATVKVARIEDLARRFGMEEADVIAELELAACCGVPPYTPDALMEIVVTGDTVETMLSTDLARPRRLTTGEGWALAAAARAILSVPGAERDGALAGALVKLETVLGTSRGVAVEFDVPALLDEVRGSTANGSQLRIRYHSASADETTERLIDPCDVVSLDGHWYLDAFCHRAEGLRRFRIDRIASIEVLDTKSPPAKAAGPTATSAFVPGPGSVEVTLRLGPGARWLSESIPALELRATERAEDVCLLTLAVGGSAWLERVLLQAGPEARVIAPADMVGLGEHAAERLLELYRSDDVGSKDTEKH